MSTVEVPKDQYEAWKAASSAPESVYDRFEKLMASRREAELENLKVERDRKLESAAAKHAVEVAAINEWYANKSAELGAVVHHAAPEPTPESEESVRQATIVIAGITDLFENFTSNNITSNGCGYVCFRDMLNYRHLAMSKTLKQFVAKYGFQYVIYHRMEQWPFWASPTVARMSYDASNADAPHVFASPHTSGSGWMSIGRTGQRDRSAAEWRVQVCIDFANRRVAVVCADNA